MKRTTVVHVTGAIFGTAVLLAAGTAVASAEDNTDVQDQVTVTVDVDRVTQPGVLALSLASDSTSLTENGSNEIQRVFTGELPKVTVTDTRDPAQIVAGNGWAVTGVASDFVSPEGHTISAANFGWTPALVGYQGDGEVFAGEAVLPAVDGDRGLQGTELLYSTLDSASVRPEGSWSATAALALKTSANVAPGSYMSTLTLSLFE